MTATAEAPRRAESWTAAAAAAIAVAAYLPSRIPLANIDDYNVRPFASDYWGSLGDIVLRDAPNGRFRPLYWAVEGLLGLLTGPSGTVLHAGRLAFLAAAVGLQVLLSARLGAGLLPSALLSIATAWSLPALETWLPGGPSEAFAQAFAVACTLAVLRARSARAVILAAALGLAACLMKETYSPWTAAALGARAVSALLARERGAVVAAALSGAAIQLAPPLTAFLLVKALSSSYLGHVLTAVSASPVAAVAEIVRWNALALALGVIGLAAIAVRLARTRPRTWPPEDLVVLAVAGGATAATIALGYSIPRYFLPLNGALALVAARGAAGLRAARVPAWARAAVAVLLVVATAAGGARAALDAHRSLIQHRADERMRRQLGDALAAGGGLRVFWIPEEVERPIGAVKHLAADGIRGDVAMQPCVAPIPASAQTYLSLFARYSVSVGPAATVFASTDCPGAPRVPLDRACSLALPGIQSFLPRYGCFDVAERAVRIERY